MKRPWTTNEPWSADIIGDLAYATDPNKAKANRELMALAPEMAIALEAYALPALNYLGIKAMSASDRAEFRDREAKVRAILARLPGGSDVRQS